MVLSLQCGEIPELFRWNRGVARLQRHRATADSRSHAPGVPRSAEEFLANFHRSVMTDPALRAGFRERVVGVRVDHFGHVAHAYVTFEGYVPRADAYATPVASTRGVDSI